MQRLLLRAPPLGPTWPSRTLVHQLWMPRSQLLHIFWWLTGFPPTEESCPERMWCQCSRSDEAHPCGWGGWPGTWPGTRPWTQPGTPPCTSRRPCSTELCPVTLLYLGSLPSQDPPLKGQPWQRTRPLPLQPHGPSPCKPHTAKRLIQFHREHSSI